MVMLVQLTRLNQCDDSLKLVTGIVALIGATIAIFKHLDEKAKANETVGVSEAIRFQTAIDYFDLPRPPGPKELIDVAALIG